MKMSGNTMLITGGTSGIGRALAEAFHTRGNKVVIAGRRQHLLHELTTAHPGMEAIELDASSDSSTRAFTDEVKKRYPSLNVLINNAGIARPEDYTADSIDLETAHSTIRTNIVSVVEITAELLPLLRSQPAATLMATTSGLAFTPMAGMPVYCATKAFIHSWLDSLRFQLRNTSVEVLDLAPPYVQTELGGDAQKADPRAMPLDAFTHEVLALLEAGQTPRGEVLVDRVKPLRWAERDGQYEQLMEAMGHF